MLRVEEGGIGGLEGERQKDRSPKGLEARLGPFPPW